MHINQIIDYMHCPYKIKYSLDDAPKFLDVTNIKTIAIASVTKLYLYSRQENKNMSFDSLKKQLSKVWNVLKSSISFGYNWEDLTKLSDYCFKIPDLFPREHMLVAINYPTQLELGKISITGNADVITIDKEHKQILVTVFDFNSRSYLEESIKQAYYINAIKFDLKYLKYQLVYRQFRLATTVLKIIDNYIDRKQLEILSNVAKSINVFYPRLTYDEVCKACVYKKSCEWITRN